MVAPFESITGPTKPISSFKVAWDAVRKKAKVNCTWHCARHTFISTLAEGGASDRIIMELAGHVSKKMLQHYSHIGNTAKMQAIAAAFNPALKAPASKTASRQQWARISRPKGISANQPVM